MHRLRSLGIYQPPGDVRRVYALLVGDGFFLYDYEYGATLPPRFEVRPDGTVLDWHGNMTDWSSEELFDTGETLGA
jgi:hypothetical protein